MVSATEQVAVREWVKVPNIPGLYRNAISGRYYGMKRYAAGGKNARYVPLIAKLQSDEEYEQLRPKKKSTLRCARNAAESLIQTVVQSVIKSV
jgi:hypothetical protein